VDVTARLYYDQCNFKIGYPFGDPVATSIFREVQRGEWWGSELQLSKRLWEKHTITAGVEYRDDFRQEQRVFDQSTTYRDVHASRQSHGVYAQGDFAVLTNLHFNGGVRYDQYGDFDPSFNPRLALIYSPVEKSTFKALYGTASGRPIFWNSATHDSKTSSRKKSRPMSWCMSRGSAALAFLSRGFYNQMDHLIAFENGIFANIDAESRGAELALEGNWAGGVRGRASYTFQKTQNRSSSRDFSDSPEHLFKFNLSVPLIREKLFAGLEFQYTSSRRTVFTTVTGDTLPGVDAADFGVVNFTLFSRNLLKNLELSASIYNLLDESYADPSTRFHLQDQLPRDGRSFRVKLTYRF